VLDAAETAKEPQVVPPSPEMSTLVVVVAVEQEHLLPLLEQVDRAF
jgi:hypothetical protein